jgi:hypothetical protein
MKAALSFLILALLAFSCTTQEVCEEDSVSEVVISCKTESEAGLSDTIVPGLRIYGIREGQSIWFLWDTVNQSTILLPLDPHHAFSRFVFETDEKTDTLTLNHSSQDYMISYLCGFGNLFTLEEIQYVGTMFMKDTIINPKVNASLEEVDTNIWLYF